MKDVRASALTGAMIRLCVSRAGGVTALSRLSKIDRSFITHMSRRGYACNLSTLVRLARAMKLTPAQLLSEAQEQIDANEADHGTP